MSLTSDPEKRRQWQQRAQARAVERLRERGRKMAPREQSKPVSRAPSSFKVKKESDGPWRNECILLYGEYCRCCGSTRGIQMDHICPKSQGGKNHVGNGLPLCSECHRRKTDSEIKIDWQWLTPGHVEHLAEIGWVVWDQHGQPTGRGWKHFSPRSTRLRD